MPRRQALDGTRAFESDVQTRFQVGIERDARADGQPLGARHAAQRPVRVLIPDAESVFAVAVLRCLAAAPGVEVHLLTAKRWAPIRFSRYHRSLHVWDGAGGEAGFLEAIERVSRAIGPDVVLPVDERAMGALSAERAMGALSAERAMGALSAERAMGALSAERHEGALSSERAMSTLFRHRAGFAHRPAIALVPPLDVLDTAADKSQLARVLAAAGITHPRTLSADDWLADGASPGALAFPVLAKPARGGYGRGIHRFGTHAELRAFFSRNAPVEPYVLQEVIDGFDIDCSVLCRDGRIIASTTQRAVLPGYHDYGAPAGVQFVRDDDVLRTTAALMEALGYSGIAHVDLRRDRRDGRTHVIEINPRFWGSLLGSLLAGVNFPWLACLAALGEPLPAQSVEPIRFLAGRAALREAMRSALDPRGVSPSIDAAVRNTSALGHALRDPGPAIGGAVGPLAVRMTRRRAVAA